MVRGVLLKYIVVRVVLLVIIQGICSVTLSTFDIVVIHKLCLVFCQSDGFVFCDFPDALPGRMDEDGAMFFG